MHLAGEVTTDFEGHRYMAITTVQGEVAEEQAGRIDLYVRTLVELSRSKLKGLFAHGCVSLNELPCADPATRVSVGDSVVVTYDPHQGYSARKRPWSDRTFEIVHEDEHLLVINKAAGVLSVPTNKKEPNTLVDRVTFYLSRKKKNHEAILIHRLDRGVSGVMVFGKTPDAAKELRVQFSSDQPKLVFVAIVHGVVKQDSGTIESYLATHKNLNRYSILDEQNGVHAITKFKVLKRMKDATCIEVELVTARRHQGRVHLFEAGHKVLGDPRYGDSQHPHERWQRKRLAMHAISLTFVHPNSGQEVTYTSELPTPMKKFLRGG